MKDRPGQDLLVQARSGLVAASGNGGTGVGAAICDQHGGALLVVGVLGAYVRRLKTGKGSRVEGSLFNAAIDLQGEAVTNYLSGPNNTDLFARDPHLSTWFHQAPYGIYPTSNGHKVAISLNDPVKLAEALDDPGLREMQSADLFKQRDEYARATSDATGKRTLADIEARLDGAQLWWAPVHNYTDLANEPQAIHNRVFEKIAVRGGTATVVNHMLRYDGEVPAVRHLALDIGNDTLEILRELGYEESRIEELNKAGAVGGVRLTAA